jgi:hypothetical protein
MCERDTTVKNPVKPRARGSEGRYHWHGNWIPYCLSATSLFCSEDYWQTTWEKMYKNGEH